MSERAIRQHSAPNRRTAGWRCACPADATESLLQDRKQGDATMASQPPTATTAGRAGAFDPARKFVRVRQLRPDRFIEFDFAIGEPEIFVEMILHADAFDDFCALNKVSFLTDAASSSPETNDWRLSEVSGRQFK
jgi:phenol hydroxylase P0 protein